MVHFHYGANKEGYWNFNHMALQLEDCVDCLNVLYPDFAFLFLFDHSSGHAKRSEDSLSAKDMNAGYGGKQPSMHSTNVHQADGILGSFEHEKMLKVGDIQSMDFEDGSNGPFSQTEAQRNKTRLDKLTGKKKTKKYTRIQLIEKLKQDGRDIPQGRISYGAAKDRCEASGIATTYEEETVVEGWLGKPKGLKQVL